VDEMDEKCDALMMTVMVVDAVSENLGRITLSSAGLLTPSLKSTFEI
jgi:hypothetical protein